MRLTKRFIDNARYEGDGTSRDVRWDDDPRGLGLRIYGSGQKPRRGAVRCGPGTRRIWSASKLFSPTQTEAATPYCEKQRTERRRLI